MQINYPQVPKTIILSPIYLVLLYHKADSSLLCGEVYTYSIYMPAVG